MFNKRTILSIFLYLSIAIAYAQNNDNNELFNADENAFNSEHLDIINEVEIYPNPSVKYIVVEIKNSELYDVEFELRSIIGNKLNVIPENIGQDKYRFNVKSFAPGYYFVVVKDDNTQFKQAHKFLKK